MIRALLLCATLMPGAALAQDQQRLADIRQNLSALYIEVQRLNQELNTTGAPSLNLQGTSALERIDAMEAELRRLTGEIEEAENRIVRVVQDGTNRIGDLEFRLCELEPGCDIASLGETPTLGGETGRAPEPAAPQPVTEGAQLAVSEQADYDRAMTAFDEGSYRTAADLFVTFAETYPGGPLTADAHYFRGQALTELGEEAGAARAYLDAFSGAPASDRAPEALLQLGLSLDTLGQGADACSTLAEVTSRFPDSSAAREAQTARADLACG